MLLSVVIPTRERPETLHYALASVLSQTCAALEVVVMDNCSGPETRAVVEAFADDRVKYCRSGARLAMSDNWELGLAQVTGDYVFFLGDDDALMPDALHLALDFFEHHPEEILAWVRASYIWPSSFVPFRNRLYLNLQVGLQEKNTFTLLEAYYAGQCGYDDLPMIYNAWVPHSLLHKITKSYGRYFLHPCPDVYSGIVNAFFTTKIWFSTRPLSLAGSSGNSTGMSQLFPNLNPIPKQKFKQEQAERPPIHPLLIDSDNMEIYLADVKLKTKDLFFPEEDRFSVNLEQILTAMVDRLPRNPGLYETMVVDIQTFARKHQLPIPALPPCPRLEGGIFQGPYQGTNLAINCEQAGITDVWQAARIAQALLPPCLTLG